MSCLPKTAWPPTCPGRGQRTGGGRAGGGGGGGQDRRDRQQGRGNEPTASLAEALRRAGLDPNSLGGGSGGGGQKPRDRGGRR
ncbi:hypothetical protein GCM10023259_085760 [Thermocatellispora tengchongensis]